MSTVIGLVIVLGVLIFFHELGHFLVAKAFGVGVERFSLGFGPKILKKTIGETQYCISALPLGGYVKMVGEQPDAELDDAEIPYSFTHKPVSRRMLIVAAGPFFNFILCILIFFGIFSISGERILEPVIGKIKDGSPAQSAGLESGDRVVAVQDKVINAWPEMAESIARSGGRPIDFTIERDGRRRQVTISPVKEWVEDVFGETRDRFLVGITAAGEFRAERLNPVAAMGESLRRTYMIVELTIVSVVKLIQGAISADTLGGPIMIAQLAGEQVEHGMVSLLAFIGLVSVNLGILNLLPVPVLDGGHILFFGIEAIIGRPVSLRVREVAQQVGIFLLMLLMVFVFYNDIMRLLTG